MFFISGSSQTGTGRAPRPLPDSATIQRDTIQIGQCKLDTNMFCRHCEDSARPLQCEVGLLSLCLYLDFQCCACDVLDFHLSSSVAFKLAMCVPVIIISVLIAKLMNNFTSPVFTFQCSCTHHQSCTKTSIDNI